MLTVPLPFVAGLVFVLAMQHILKGVEASGSRRYFAAFLVVYAAQGLIVGLHFGYGISALAPVQPVTAAVLPPLAYLAFRGLTGRPAERPWQHGLAPLLLLAAVLVARVLIDPLLLAVFLAYGVAIWRLAGTAGEEVMVEASLPRMRPARLAARLTAGLMLFFAISDAALALHAAFAGNGDVPRIVALVNVVAIVIAGAAAVLYRPHLSGRADRSEPASAGAEMLQRPGQGAAPASEEDAASLARIQAALEEDGLYRDENLSLARLARKAGLAPRAVSAAINRAAGLNVSQFVNARRIAEACRLLAETDQSATRIMLDAGFSTKSNFNREFRRITGMSPRQWRTAARREARSRDNGLDLHGTKKQLGNIQRG